MMDPSLLGQPPMPNAAPDASDQGMMAPPSPMPPPEDPVPGVLDNFLEELKAQPDWSDLSIQKKHIDERVVEMLAEWFEEDLKTLVEFIDVGDRPAFHLIPPDDELVAQWQDPSIKHSMLGDAMEAGGPKAVTELLDKMNKLENRFWTKVLKAPTMTEGGS